MQKTPKNLNNDFDVIIVGAGPAGLACALELQKSQLKILIVDKKKIIGPKVCAGGLTIKIKDLGIPLAEAELLFSSVDVSVDEDQYKVTNGGSPYIGTISREKLGQILLAKISPKVTVRTGCDVAEISRDHIIIDGKKIKYKYLVGADGSRSIVRKNLRIETKKFLVAIQYLVPEEYNSLEFYLNSYMFGSGYSWVFPHRGFTSIGCCQDIRMGGHSKMRNNLDSWMKQKSINTKKDLQGWTINFDYKGYGFGNQFLIGDAGGFASGLTGEGIYFAMISGRDVARKIIDPEYDCFEIKKILKIKRQHERVLTIASFLVRLNKKLANFIFKYIFRLTQKERFAKKIIAK